MNRYLILGTAGHIDHGKSSIVKALTGIDPDRLPEEKAREITIDLGFAHLRRPAATLGFVDVPGHERFVRNMLAGIGGVDGYLMVVSAAEGIREQTREHAEILRLLGIREGIVAVSKFDLAEKRADVLEECREYFAELFGTAPPVLPVSVRTGEGIDRLLAEIDALIDRLPDREASGVFRLGIDRAFSLHGVGTVVTGTAVGGRVHVGDEVDILPGGLRARVRQIQVYGESVQEARAGQRVAINLHGVDREDLQRGLVVASPPGALESTTRLLVSIEEVSLASRPLRQGERVRVCAGAAEVLGRCHLLSGKELAPGAPAVFAELKLEAPLVVFHGDPFILRSFSPVETHGGGRVVESRPMEPLRRHAPEELEALAAGRIEPLLRRRGLAGLSQAEFVRRTGRSFDANTVSELGDSVILLDKGARLVWREAVELVEGKIVEAARAYHAANPLRPGIALRDLAAQLRSNEGELAPALERLVARNEIRLTSGTVSTLDFSAKPRTGEDALVRLVEELFQKSGRRPIETAEVERETKQPRSKIQPVLQFLLAEKRLVRVASDIFLHADGYADLAGALALRKVSNPRIGVAEFKELTGTTRRLAIPLLEFLDRQRLTRRDKDERIIV